VELTQEFVEVRRDGRVVIVSLDRPKAHNALSGAMADELSGAFKEVTADDDAWVLLLRANGDKAFCVGADLKERASFTLEDFHTNRKQIRGMFEALRAVPSASPSAEEWSWSFPPTSWSPLPARCSACPRRASGCCRRAAERNFFHASWGSRGPRI
jgi:hypothetical protein